MLLPKPPDVRIVVIMMTAIFMVFVYISSADPVENQANETPRQWTEFCEVQPDQCLAEPSGPLKITPAILRLLVSVNRAVNQSVAHVSDEEEYGKVDLWRLPLFNRGDCEDIALKKRRRLMHSGLPAGALLMTIVTTPEFESHAVLVVRTHVGNIVLDNVIQEPRFQEDSPHHFRRQQTSDNPNFWRPAMTVNGD